MTRAVWPGMLALAAVLTAAAQQPAVKNTQLELVSAAGGLEPAVRGLIERQTAPVWIGYSVPLIEGEQAVCCHGSGYGDCCGACRLEKGSGITLHTSGPGEVRLEEPRELLVLLRVEGRNLDRLRVFTGECRLDAGGVPLYWLTEVKPAESVRFLESLIGRDEEVSGKAVSAIALHAAAEADRALESFVEPSRPEWLREKTSFWLGAARGRRGFELLRRMLESDPSLEVRKRVVFGIYVSKVPESTELLLRTARNHPSSAIRSKALFWVAQEAGRQAAATLSDAVEEDPELEVKKRAVFALSQLPADEGVPLLIRVARTHKHPEIRRKAIFWLGQSNDPRALAFFEEILSR